MRVTDFRRESCLYELPKCILRLNYLSGKSRSCVDSNNSDQGVVLNVLSEERPNITNGDVIQKLFCLNLARQERFIAWNGEPRPREPKIHRGGPVEAEPCSKPVRCALQ